MPEQKTPRMKAAEMLEHLKRTVSHFPDLSEEQQEQYINEHMKRAGYKPNTSWGDPDDSGSGGNSGGGWFPS